MAAVGCLLLPFSNPLVAQQGGAGAGGAAAGAPAAAVGGGTGAVPAAQGQQAGSKETNSQTRQARDISEVPAGSQDVPTEFQQMVANTTGRRLEVYGEAMFRNVPTTFAPVTDVPVNPGYMLGPGDELHIQLSGQVNRLFNVTVDRSGNISLPEIGTVQVAGTPFGELPALLKNQAGKIYRNFDLNVNLSSLRTIQVFVVGHARRPGTYTISSLSTLLNALFESGGPLPQGSLRDIQVRRNNQTITHFDMYDLLLRGDKSRDVSLVNGDVIFIPTVGPEVAVVGSVNNPAIYELRGETTLAEVLKLAGGETPVAAGQAVRLERVHDHRDRSIEDVNPVTDGELPLRAGDILSVTSIVDRFRDAVTLRGNVANPGRYVWHPGMRISDLIPNKESLITRNYWRKRNELGQLAQDYSGLSETDKEEGSLNARSGTSGVEKSTTGPIEGQRNAATADPGGNSVGQALLGSNEVFSAKTDVVLSAPDIDWSYAVIERQSAEDLTTSLIPFDLGSIILRGDPTQNYELLPGDVVTIFSKADLRVPTSQQTRYVKLEGEFVHVGVYSVLPGETLRGLLRRAGGLTPDAYLYASEFTRESTRRVEEQRLSEYADTLEAQITATTSANLARAVTSNDQVAAEASTADAKQAVARLRQIQPVGRIVLALMPSSQSIESVPDIALEDGDRFIVPRVPANVNVEGQVYSANAFVFQQGHRMIDYLREAGGPDRDADKKRMFILRADGAVVSRQYNHLDSASIYPGDTIVVPPVLDKRALLQRILDVATIIGNLGFTAAAINVVR
jgi:polysaccharide export outer membrane protein